MTSVEPVPDTAAAVEFLKLVYSHGPWVLTAIRPDRKAVETQTFRPETEHELERWLVRYNGERNIYWSVNRPVRDLHKKASREDIKEVAYLHVDIDPRVGEDFETEKERCLALLTNNLPPSLPQPTIVLFSGGGYQAFWKLANPIPISGYIGAAEKAKLFNLKLEQLLGGDNCHNVDRIMRLPGTVNVPDERKLAKGRKPALAMLIACELDLVYPLSMFTAANAIEPAPAGPLAPVMIGDAVRTADPEELNQWNVPDRVKVIMVQGHHPDEPKLTDGSRSVWQFDFVCHMVRFKVPDERILGILLDSEYAISASVIDKGRNARRYAERQIRRAHEFVALDELEFETNEHGKPKLSQHNIRAAMHKLRVSVRHDVFSNGMLIDGLPGFDVLGDAAVIRLRLLLDKKFKLLFQREFFFDVVLDLARHAPFHPVCDYLDGLSWDKKPRLDSWLTTYAGVESNEYTRAVGALVLMAAVRRVRQPGCKFDEMLVLECSQGTDKSSALSTLAVRSEWFSDDLPLNADTAKVVERLSGKWIVEAAELKGLKAAGIEHLKAFLSRRIDVARAVWNRIVAETPRQSIFIGTTNTDNYLRDDTGNRRFWPVKIERFDIPALARDRDQLWAEAAMREAEGVSIRLDSKLYALAAVEQEARRVDDPFVSVFRDALGEHEGKLRAADAWIVLDIPVGIRNQDHNSRMGAALRELGWKKKMARFGAKNSENAYVKGRAKHPKRVKVERTEAGHVRVFYDGVRPEPPPF